jgi:heme A synthase
MPSGCGLPGGSAILPLMEFLNFLLIMAAGWLVWRRPERERLAFALLVVSFIVMAAVFLIGTHTSLIPAVNL